MTITVLVKFEKNKLKVERIEDNKYFVYVKSPPKQGKANEEILKNLAKYFKVEEKDIVIISGKTERKKQVLVKKH